MKFRIETTDGTDSKDYRATSVHEFRNDLCGCNDADFNYFVDNKPVSLETAFNIADQLIAEKLEKKQQTHKQVFVSIGASKAHNTYHKVWVRK
jgi:hypothetical protein